MEHQCASSPAVQLSSSSALQRVSRLCCQQKTLALLLQAAPHLTRPCLSSTERYLASFSSSLEKPAGSNTPAVSTSERREHQTCVNWQVQKKGHQPGLPGTAELCETRADNATHAQPKSSPAVKCNARARSQTKRVHAATHQRRSWRPRTCAVPSWAGPRGWRWGPRRQRQCQPGGRQRRR
jgi:hypothetical protein